ncbi:MAG: hypothetical protein QOD96_3899 [Pseudonocardiales bacterium]|nr:hypothetical protein [Pseudonocardiales bacterium]
MPEGREVTDVTVDTHSLLLSLAGLLDDELLGWCRELVAVGEGDYALELVTAAVQADRVRLPAATHEALLAAAGRLKLLGRGESLPAPDAAPRLRHRFLADPAGGGFPMVGGERSPEHALASVPARLLRNCELWLSWRCTPTGSAPGPLPHPVVLIEVDESDGADVLAYQVGEVLLRAGVFASVEVFAADTELSEYHRAALAEAVRVEVTGDRPLPEATRPAGQNGRAGGARPEPAANGGESRTRDTARRPEPPRPGPIAGSDGSRPTPLRPVDRVITARGSAPRRPRTDRPDRSDAGFDEIASGLTFDRAGAGSDDDMFGPDGPGPDRAAGPADQPIERRPADQPRGGDWGGSREPAGGPPRDEPKNRPGPPPRPATSGPGPFSAGPDRTGANRPVAPGGPGGPAGPPKRPPTRPDDTADGPLSDVEQRLLRQLHEELAAREDRGSAPPGKDQPRIFRGANGGRKPRPARPNDPPPAS